MKAKRTRTSTDTDDTDAWLAELHEENDILEPDGILRPGGGLTQPPASLTRPYVGLGQADGPAAPDGPPAYGQQAPKVIPGQALHPGAGPWPIPARPDELQGPASGQFRGIPADPFVPRGSSGQVTQRAVIGDELRRPVLWCQMGSCVTRFADPGARGEADNRARAIDAGWREDAFARFACPACLQTSPEFRVKYPVVAWDKKRAIAMATLMTAAIQHYRHSDPADDTGWIPAIPPGSIPRQRSHPPGIPAESTGHRQ